MPGKKGGARQISRAYDALLLSVIDLLETGRQIAARSVNAVLTMTYWQVGQRLVEHEQGGAERADYGSGLLKRLSRDLQARLGRGFSERNLEQMRQFYLQWPIFADAVCEFRPSDSDPNFADSVCEIGDRSSIPAVPVVLVPLCAADPHRGRRSPPLL
jgi:hypothetical protein